MARQYPSLLAEHRALIAAQKIFFVASATADSRVNVSPKGHDCLRVIDDATICYRDLTGSGAETAAHLSADGRLTVMFCTFEARPVILRLYGRGYSHPAASARFAQLIDRWFDGDAPRGTRQVVELAIDLVQTSCGFAVPLFDYVGERDLLDRWAAAKSDEELAAYQAEKNARSIDGLPTGLLAD